MRYINLRKPLLTGTPSQRYVLFDESHDLSVSATSCVRQTFHFPSLRYSSAVDALAKSLSVPFVNLIVSSSTFIIPQIQHRTISSVASITKVQVLVCEKVSCIEPSIIDILYAGMKLIIQQNLSAAFANKARQ